MSAGKSAASRKKQNSSVDQGETNRLQKEVERLQGANSSLQVQNDTLENGIHTLQRSKYELQYLLLDREEQITLGQLEKIREHRSALLAEITEIYPDMITMPENPSPVPDAAIPNPDDVAVAVE